MKVFWRKKVQKEAKPDKAAFTGDALSRYRTLEIRQTYETYRAQAPRYVYVDLDNRYCKSEWEAKHADAKAKRKVCADNNVVMDISLAMLRRVMTDFDVADYQMVSVEMRERKRIDGCIEKRCIVAVASTLDAANAVRFLSDEAMAMYKLMT